MSEAPSPSAPFRQEPRFRRLWSAGLLASLIRWLDLLVFGVFAYQQTHSAFWVTTLTMLRMLPMAVLGLAWGAVSARVSRRQVLLWSNLALLATTLVLLGVTLLGALSVWHLAVASLISGAVWAGDMPVRRGYIGDVVGPLHMRQAMAADAIANNGSRLAGPGAGGLLLAAGGMTAVLAVDAVLYLAVLWALAGLPRSSPAVAEGAPASGRVLATLASGMQALRENHRLRAALCNTVIFNVFCWPVVSLVPVIAQSRLNLGTRGTGLLASMDGLGSLLGALVLASLARQWRPGHVYMGGTALFLALLPVFALSRSPVLSGVAMVGIGAGQGAFAVMQSTLVFLAAPPQRRMEAMGLVTMCIGVAPLGFVMVGWLAEWQGASGAAIICAVSGLLALVLTRRVWRVCLHDDVPPAAQDAA